MKTNRIQPTDTIFVVDFKTEEIYEMTAGEFAEQYYDDDATTPEGIQNRKQLHYDQISGHYCVKTWTAGVWFYSVMYDNREDAEDQLFLEMFDRAADNDNVIWCWTRKQAEGLISDYLEAE